VHRLVPRPPVRLRRPLQWRIGDLQRVIDTRLKIGPAIIEGVLAFDALEEAQRSPDFLIFVDGNNSSRQLGPRDCGIRL
jgi:hypothetical protein